jgi:hypothetical protein
MMMMMVMIIIERTNTHVSTISKERKEEGEKKISGFR